MTGVPFLYRCDVCGFEAEARYPMGHAPESLPCMAQYGEWPCDGWSRRVYTPLAAPAFPGSHKAEYRGK